MLRPVNWVGGKARLANRLAALLPEHRRFCEVFGGGAAVLFAKPPSEMEVYNDLDEGLVNFFRVVRNPRLCKRLIRLLRFTPYARKEWDWSRRRWKHVNTDRVERARRWYVVARQSFGGIFGSSWAFDVGAEKSSANVWSRRIEELMQVSERLRRVQVDCLDWRRCADRYNEWGTDGVFYMDPPYAPSTRKSNKLYQHEMTEDDHRELIDWLLSDCKVRVLLSGYDSALYRTLEKNGWARKEFRANCSCAGRTRGSGRIGTGSCADQARTEVVWANYQLN